MLTIVSHDAGGAEILSSYVRQQRPACQFVLAGPARSIFKRKLGPIAERTLDEALASAGRMLCGTSWQSDLEVEAIRGAAAKGIPSAAFLDHWVHYRERFTRDGRWSLPDEIWVGDRSAERLAREVFPGHEIRFVANPYFEDLRLEIAAFATAAPAHDEGLSVLYVCEPIREHALKQHGNEYHWGYGEEDALRFFLRHLPALGSRVRQIVVRPHPSETRDKYDWAPQEFQVPITIGGSATLLQEVAASDIVVGCQSMAMFAGVLAGKRVVSSIPPGGPACALPQPEIESLRALVAGSGSDHEVLP